MKPRAIISVYDKTGIDSFCRGLCDLNFEIVASGGTAKALAAAGIEVKEVSDVTGFPEILGGRVKTLHPAIHGGLLARRSQEHIAELGAHDIKLVDVLVCNLYPFSDTVRSGASENEIIEQIDIGGVALLRAAAKNFESVTVVCDPEDYDWVLESIRSGMNSDARRTLAAKVFALTNSYDAAITQWLSGGCDDFHLAMSKVSDLRYGENPHQKAMLYRLSGEKEALTLLRGKELSYNNIVDADAAYSMVETLTKPSVAIIKHTNPCGLASAATANDAFQLALQCDPVSAFGSVIAVNAEVDLSLVQLIGKLFVEVLIAPSFTEDTLAWIGKNKKNCRVVVAGPDSSAMMVKAVRGNFLFQTLDKDPDDESNWKVVTKRAPTENEMESLRFAWHAVRHVKSNAIVFAKDTHLVGVGAGQMNRVDSVFLAARRAGENARGTVMGSDAFFPFSDGIEMAAQAGVTACIQPGGSVRDADAIEAADRAGMAMIFTGKRHFKH